MSEGRQYEDLRYPFTEQELLVMGQHLAALKQEQNKVRDQKKAAVAIFAGSLNELEKQMGELSQKIASGYELRPTEVMVLFDTPRVGAKRIIRIDTNETVREEPMTHSEMQGSFGFSFEDRPEPEK